MEKVRFEKNVKELKMPVAEKVNPLSSFGTPSQTEKLNNKESNRATSITGINVPDKTEVPAATKLQLPTLATPSRTQLRLPSIKPQLSTSEVNVADGKTTLLEKFSVDTKVATPSNTSSLNVGGGSTFRSATKYSKLNPHSATTAPHSNRLSLSTMKAPSNQTIANLSSAAAPPMRRDKQKSELQIPTTAVAEVPIYPILRIGSL